MSSSILHQHMELVRKTFRSQGDYAANLAYIQSGLAEEHGEVAKVLHKHIYSGRVLDLEALQDELGDVLWWIVSLHDIVNLDVQETLTKNIIKLEKRAAAREKEKTP